MQIRMTSIPAQAALNFTIQPVWDTVLFGTSQAQPIQVFQTPRGQSSKTTVETNMNQSGGFPSPNVFYLRGISQYLVPRYPANAAFLATDVTDMGKALEAGIFTFYIGTSGRRLVEASGLFFPAGLGLDGCISTYGATTGGTSYILGNGQRRMDNRFGFGEYAEVLNPTESFRGEFNFPQGTLSLSNSLSVRTILVGVFGQQVG